jgi:hypothetical protein
VRVDEATTRAETVPGGRAFIDALLVPDGGCTSIKPNAFSSAYNSSSAEIATRGAPSGIAAQMPASSIHAGNIVRDRSAGERPVDRIGIGHLLAPG